jgi:hypothetical protein
MDPTERDRLHADPANWKLGIFYFCREDVRILVPKRIRGLGWTINFARPAALLWIAVIAGLVLGTVELARLAGADSEMRMAIKVILAVGIIVFCHRAANASAGN